MPELARRLHDSGQTGHLAPSTSPGTPMRLSSSRRLLLLVILIAAAPLLA
ncbi:hypothetical protein [Pseudoxanthomonas sp. USHLN014]